MASTTTAQVPTANAAKYLQRLCKHWSHRLEVDLQGDQGTVRFGDAVAHMTADPSGLTVTIEAGDEGSLERLKGVVASHLDRFAFREAPLPFSWQDA